MQKLMSINVDVLRNNKSNVASLLFHVPQQVTNFSNKFELENLYQSFLSAWNLISFSMK